MSQAQASAPFDTVGFLMSYEGGELSDADVVDGFQRLIDDGTVWSLQGSYIRTANELIESGHCTRPAPKEQPVGQSSTVGPFERVSRDQIRSANGEEFRVLLYGGYNAFGLIGSERNGIAVLSEKRREVVCADLGIEPSGPTAAQVDLFNKLMTCPDEEFRTIVNQAKKLRDPI